MQIRACERSMDSTFSTTSDSESRPLRIPRGRVEAHLSNLESILNRHVEGSQRVRVVVTEDTIPWVVGIAGAGCEFIRRERGSRAYVAPMLRLDGGLWAWIGFREEWDVGARRNERLTFRMVGFTVHFGYKYSTEKPQVFRAEWAGWAQWNAGEWGYQAGSAGHPHWQVDALESIHREEAAERAATYLSVLRLEQEAPEVRDFSPKDVGQEEIRDVVGIQELSRIHFASAAPWWKSAPEDAHMHSPGQLLDVERWFGRTLQYTVQELRRLQKGV